MFVVFLWFLLMLCSQHLWSWFNALMKQVAEAIFVWLSHGWWNT